MSTKGSIFLTEDNEHCYYETIKHVVINDECIGFEIELEIDKKHAELSEDDENIFITLKNPNSQIYKLIQMLQDKENDL